MKGALSKRMEAWLGQLGFGDRVAEAMANREQKFDFKGETYRVKKLGVASGSPQRAQRSSPQKRGAQCYRVDLGGEVVTYVLFDELCELLVQSEWGVYSHRWPKSDVAFSEFLLSCDCDYLAQKLMSPPHYGLPEFKVLRDWLLPPLQGCLATGKGRL